MSLSRGLADRLNPMLRIVGAQLVGNKQLEHYKSVREKYLPDLSSLAPSAQIPAGSGEYLKVDNPRLQELKKRYVAYQCPATLPAIWTDSHVSLIDLIRFRDDSPYVFQRFDNNGEVSHILTAYYLQRKDRLGLLTKLKEDGLFGAQTYEFDDGVEISRDLLDSINEINFLEEALGISRIPDLKVLDIGAGYGRFAHRLSEAVPSIGGVLCTDAVAMSTFLCEFYLRVRGATTARVLPLDEAEHRLAEEKVNLAVNIHSFSECRMEAVEWWLDLLAKNRVRYLFIVPNAVLDGGRTLALHNKAGGDPTSYEDAILRRGYKRIGLQPKYDRPSLQRSGVSPTWYHLYELEGQ